MYMSELRGVLDDVITKISIKSDVLRNGIVDEPRLLRYVGHSFRPIDGGPFVRWFARHEIRSRIGFAKSEKQLNET
jgi:hypothetical protein